MKLGQFLPFFFLEISFFSACKRLTILAWVTSTMVPGLPGTQPLMTMACLVGSTFRTCAVEGEGRGVLILRLLCSVPTMVSTVIRV